MSFLGLVGIPTNTMTYPAYQALKTAAPALASAFASAEAAALLAIASRGSAVLGAGALGWMIGTAIRQGLGLDYEPPELSNYQEAGTPGVPFIVQFTFSSPPNAPINSEVVVEGKVAGPLRETLPGGDDRFYMRQVAPPLNVTMVQFAPSANPDANIQITGFRAVPGFPVPAFAPTPVSPQTTPKEPLKVPAIIPATPGVPAIPITPTVVPTPGNDPDEDDKLREPGVTVKIPELGLQIQYTPTGVRIGAYRDPDTVPFTPPKIPGFPGVRPPASDPCPCPEEGGKDDEIICRIKTIQQKLLDDGYLTATNIAGPSSYLSVDGLPDEFYRLEIGVTQKPVNVKTQYYSVADGTVEWVGWLSWHFGLRKSERIFLQFAEMGFQPPPECTGYTVAFNIGCEGNALALTRRKKDYIDLC